MSEKNNTPSISEYLDGNLLHVRVDMPESVTVYSYAFYLILETCEETSKDIVWYQPEPTVTFKLSRSGVYHTVCFVREQGSETSQIYESKQLFHFTAETIRDHMEAIGHSEASVSIFGSCVSRDVLEYQPREKMWLKLKTYIARQSVVSAVSPPIECEDNEVTLNSAFQKRMVLRDLRKETFSELQENQSDYLIVDLIDERFDLIRIDSSYATMSNEAVESKFFQNKLGIVTKVLNRIKRRKEVGGEYYVQNVKLEYYVKEFVQRLEEIYPESRIIIHEALMKDHYIDEDGSCRKFPPNHVKLNRDVNDLLKTMYGWLRQYMPQAHVVNVNEGICADKRHKWGLAPMHYQEEYYKRVLEEILRIIDEQEACKTKD